MKILFTSVGRRVELIQAFRSAAKRLAVDITIIGADLVTDAPALYFCDEHLQVVRISDPLYIPNLVEYCAENKIDCLIPTIDTDLNLLAINKHKFEAVGTKVLISAVDKVKLCRDKNYTADYFISLGLKSPRPVNSVEKFEEAMMQGQVSFPAFIKPKDGSSSIDAYKVNNLEDLNVYAQKIGDYIIQPFISGREYTVDIFGDYEGNPVFITPRERLAVRSGEVLKTRITQDHKMIEEMKRKYEQAQSADEIMDIYRKNKDMFAAEEDELALDSLENVHGGAVAESSRPIVESLTGGEKMKRLTYEFIKAVSGEEEAARFLKTTDKDSPSSVSFII